MSPCWTAGYLSTGTQFSAQGIVQALRCAHLLKSRVGNSLGKCGNCLQVVQRLALKNHFVAVVPDWHSPCTSSEGDSFALRRRGSQGTWNMQKVLWIALALLFVTTVAPAAFGETFYPATFTCYPEPCASVPIAPDVSFPSPTLDITLLGAFFSVTLNSSDLPGDAYVWNLQFKDSTGHGGPAIPEVAVSDVTNGTGGDFGQTGDPLIGSSTNEEGCLTFTSTCPSPATPPPPPVCTPEPASINFMLTGVGLVVLLIVTRKP